MNRISPRAAFPCRLGSSLVTGAAFVAAVLSGAGTARAQANLLVNGSFENGNFGGGTTHQVVQGSTDITGWTALITGGGGNQSDVAWLQNGNPYVGDASDGVRALDLTGFDDSQPYGGMVQTLTLTQGATYALSFDLGSYQSNPSYSGPVSVEAKVGNLDQTFTFAAAANSTGQQWQSESATFTATSAATTLTFQGITSTGGQYIGLDNAAIRATGSASAPEPGSIAYLALSSLSVFGLITGRGRRKRQ